MSALDFQRAMAGLIRFPTDDLSEIMQKVGNLSLTDIETQRLEKMATDVLVRKFGFKMSILRKKDASELLRVTRHFVNDELISYLFIDLFDPSRTATDYVMIGVQFLEFMLSDPRAIELIRKSSPYAEAAVQYDLVKARTVRTIIPFEPITPEGSHLYHLGFHILRLPYDMATYDKQVTKDSNFAGMPAEKNVVLLFIRFGIAPYYKLFQIDEEVAGFLETQRDNPKAWTAPLPKVFDGLVQLGLCKKLN